MTSQGGLTWDTAGDLAIGYLPDLTPNPNYDQLWWKVTPAESGDYAFSSRDDPTGASYIYVYSGPDEGSATQVAYFSGTSRSTGYDDRAFGFAHLDAGVEYHIAAWCNPNAIITVTETYWGDWLQDPDENVSIQVEQQRFSVSRSESVNGLPSSAVSEGALNTYMNDWFDGMADPSYQPDETYFPGRLDASVHLESAGGYNGNPSYWRNTSADEGCWPMRFNVNKDMTGWQPYHNTYDYPPGALDIDINPEGYSYVSTYVLGGQGQIYFFRSGFPGYTYTNLQHISPYGGLFELRLSTTNALGSGRVVDSRDFSTLDVPTVPDYWNLPNEIPVDVASDCDANGNCWLFPRILKTGAWGHLESPMQNAIDVVLEYSTDVRNRIRPPRHRYLYASPARPAVPEIAYVPDPVRRIFS